MTWAPYPALSATTSRTLGRRPTSRTVPGALSGCLVLCLALVICYLNTPATKQVLEELFGTMAQQKKTQTQACGSGSASGTSYLDLRDSYVPVFSGQPSDYREWRQRIHLYHRKMPITKRGNESVLNIVGSFTGLTWQLFQDWALEDLEKTDAFPKIIEVLDRNFAYDARVQLPADFESYFNLLQRQGGQTLLMFINDHEEAYRKLQQHKVELPASVQGWHLLRRAGLSREQRHLITLKAPTMEKNEVIEALYLILGQDYKGGGWNVERNRRFGIQSHSWKHRACVADDYDEENYHAGR